jgi:anti-anti-sigma factor
MAHPEISTQPGQVPDGPVIVALPDEIDLLNASEVSDLLLTVLNRGAAGVIADMTRTRFCDAAGCRAVARAGRRAQLLGTWARAVIPHPAVRKAFRLTNADQLIPVFATLGDAVPGDAARLPRHPARESSKHIDHLAMRGPGPGAVVSGARACLTPNEPGSKHGSAARPNAASKAETK